MSETQPIQPWLLGIDLSYGEERALFRWLMACLLFERPVGREAARAGLLEADRARLDTPTTILDAGRKRLIELLDRAGYANDSPETAGALLNASDELLERYGTVRYMIARCNSTEDLARTAAALHSVGPWAAQTFVDGISPIWEALKADWQNPFSEPAVKNEPSRSAAKAGSGGHSRPRSTSSG